MTDFSDLVGVTLSRIDGAEQGNAQIVFTAADGRQWHMYHSQDCCESVWLADIIGDIDDLIGTPILKAEESSNSDTHPDSVDAAKLMLDDTFTWTFYLLATAKGYVTLRWLGTSNGYYSESVDFEAVRP